MKSIDENLGKKLKQFEGELNGSRFGLGEGQFWGFFKIEVKQQNGTKGKKSMLFIYFFNFMLILGW